MYLRDRIRFRIVIDSDLQIKSQDEDGGLGVWIDGMAQESLRAEKQAQVKDVNMGSVLRT